jgi:hypothetical protein
VIRAGSAGSGGGGGGVARGQVQRPPKPPLRPRRVAWEQRPVTSSEQRERKDEGVEVTYARA